ncbi:MAG: hypothetical protein L3J66_13345 [Bacteroidales bacterium]|nr:hypothetical protein [Bacteroidales bacterium]
MKKPTPLFVGFPFVMAVFVGLYFFSDTSLSERGRYEQFILQQARNYSKSTEQQQNELKAPDKPDMAAFQE